MTPCALWIMHSVIMNITQDKNGRKKKFVWILNIEMFSFVLHVGMNVHCSHIAELVSIESCYS